MKQLLALLLIALTSISQSDGQTNIRVMSYNLLNFPQGFMPDREDTLKVIIDYVQPDLLMVQELRTETGLNLIRDYSFASLPDTYATSAFVTNQSVPGPDFALQQAIVYNTRIFGLAEERLRTTGVRDINIYKLFLRDAALEQGADTTFLYAFVTHLKAGTGADNEEDRFQSIEVFNDELNEIPENSYLLIGGDFNFYDSDEPGYELLMSTFAPIVMEDPIDAPGNWSSSTYPFKQVHTQCTRENTIFDDGASGGMDNRFDFIFVSENLKDNSDQLHYLNNSYLALGNTGDCYDADITDCSENNPVPGNVLTALYHMSDHVPVVMDLETDITLATPQITRSPDYLHFDGHQIHLSNLNAFQARLEILDLSGRLCTSLPCGGMSAVPLSYLNNGSYIVVLYIDDHPADRQKIIISR